MFRFKKYDRSFEQRYGPFFYLTRFPFTDQSQYDRITETLSNKRTELKLCIFLTEHCLYLLWTHLDFYMLRAISVNSIQSNSIGRKTIISPIDAGWKITSDDIAVLRTSLIQVFNETFCQRLVAMEQVSLPVETNETKR